MTTNEEKKLTETEELEQAAKVQFAKQRLEDLHAYIDTLFLELQKAWELHSRSSLMSTSALMLLVITGIAESMNPGLWSSINSILGSLVFWVVLGREWLWVIPRFMGGRDELRGVFKTLELLGMLDKRDDGEKRMGKYKESFTAKLWAALKQKSRESAFSPA